MKKKVKITICILLAALLTISCTGCGNLFYRLVFGSENMPYSESPSGTDQPESDAPDGTDPADESSSDPAVESSSDPAQESSSTPPGTEEPSGSAPETTAGASQESTTAPSSELYPFEDRDETVYTTDSLNIRTSPSTDGTVLAVLASGKKLHRTGYHEEWSRVEFEGQTAYASSAYLTTVAPSLSNESKSYGYDHNGKRDDKNIPEAMYWYIRNWGQDADFLQDTDSNLIYLTMDEGYENGNTPKILDILKEKNVKAVFFLTKGFVDSDPELVQRMIDEGHILGNHTCSHPAKGMPSLSIDEQTDDIMTLHNMVLDQFGYEMKLFRFPSGIYSDQSLQVVSSLGYHSVFWSFNHRDFEVDNQPDPEKALDMCVNELHPGAIYLLHAVSDTNTAILADWIDAARAKGFEFGVYPVD